MIQHWFLLLQKMTLKYISKPNSVDVNTLATAKEVTGNPDYVTYKVDNLSGDVK